MFGRSTQLTIRSERITLPGLGDAARSRELVVAGAEGDTWRVVEAFSQTGGPFELDLGWSASQGVGARARITVARASRVSLYARTIRVRARNLCSDDNLVGVSIADGYAETRNQWETHGDVGPTSPAVLEVPPFARTARLELAEVSAASGALLCVVDGEGIVRARVRAGVQPAGGVLIGGARALHVLSKQPTAFRVVFDLTL